MSFAEIDTSLLFATGSTLVAALAAYFSYRSAKATLFAYEAHLISDYAEKYAAPAFLSHLRTLRKWSDGETGASKRRVGPRGAIPTVYPRLTHRWVGYAFG